MKHQTLTRLLTLSCVHTVKRFCIFFFFLDYFLEYRQLKFSHHGYTWRCFCVTLISFVSGATVTKLNHLLLFLCTRRLTWTCRPCWTAKTRSPKTRGGFCPNTPQTSCALGSSSISWWDFGGVAQTVWHIQDGWSLRLTKKPLFFKRSRIIDIYAKNITVYPYHPSVFRTQNGLCSVWKSLHGMSKMTFVLFQHPYPTEDEKRQIAAQTNLTLLQVNNW